MDKIVRGDVFYVSCPAYAEAVGSEQRAGRPAVVVSNDKCNAASPVIEVVYITTEPKADLPTHCLVHSTPQVSTVLCEQVHSISTSRLDRYVCHLTKDELSAVDLCLLTSLGLDLVVSKPAKPAQPKIVEKIVEKPVDKIVEVVKAPDDYLQLQIEKSFYEKQYNKLMTKIMKAGGLA